MTHWIRSAPLLVFLLSCLVLGGASREGVLANFVLQVVALGILGWALHRLEWRELTSSARFLLLLTIVGLCLVALQAVPISEQIWRELPGRGQLATELDLIGASPNPAFLTLSVHETIRSVVSIIPALAIGLALMACRRIPERAIAMMLVSFSIISIGIGFAQFFGGRESWLYLYEHTTRGSMVGLFANANHMATLLLIALPFTAGLVREGRNGRPRFAVELAVLGCTLFAFLAIGVVLAGSGTGYALFVPVAVASISIVWTPPRRFFFAFILPLMACAAALLVVWGDADNLMSPSTEASLTGREEIRRNTLPAVAEFFPAGTGLGTFEEVYRRYEDPQSVSRTFVNHVHNDYLELALELGAPGMLLIFALLAWWCNALRTMVSGQSYPLAWAAWIALGVMFVHSAWDYPLRTAAMSSIFAVCCVLVARPTPRHMRFL